MADLQELSDLCTRLTVTDPAAFEPLHAGALEVMVFCHGQSGAHLQAVEATGRSVALGRRLG